jgi:hypothetical protein
VLNLLRPAAALVLLAATLVAGETDPLLSAPVVLRINDGRWLERESQRFAAALGDDPATVRGELARSLYRCRSFDGVDLNRPAIIAWRGGRSPLLAAIPVANRSQFLAAFGAVDAGEPPLVRVAERDGTVVFTQNHGKEVWEYRILIAGRTAFLGRTVEECARLAALPAAMPDAQRAPIELTLRGAALAEIDPSLPAWIGRLPPLPLPMGECAMLPWLGQHLRAGLASQLAAVGLEVRTTASGDLRAALRLHAAPDSDLMGWLGQQRPTVERSAAQLRQAGAVAVVTGRLAFQGQAERWTLDLADRLKQQLGARWTGAADADYRSLCGLIERSGGWALAALPGRTQAWVVEHPRAAEAVHLAGSVLQTLRGAKAEPWQDGERSGLQLADRSGASLLAAGDRHGLRLDGPDAAALVPLAGQVLARLDQPAAQGDARPALVALWADLAQAWEVPVPEGETAIEPVPLTGAMRVVGSDTLELTAEVNLPRMAALLQALRNAGAAR